MIITKLHGNKVESSLFIDLPKETHRKKENEKENEIEKEGGRRRAAHKRFF